MVRTNTLELDHAGLHIDADVRTQKLDPEDVTSGPETVVRDERTGHHVERQQYDKATGDTLPEGHGYRWVDEDGTEVPDEHIQHYEVRDGEEQPVSRFQPTLGRGRTLTAERWIPVGRLGEFLVTRTYEMWGEREDDVAELYELAEHIRSTWEAPVLPVVLQRTLSKDWGILTPQFYDESFSLVLRVTRARVEPEHHMPIPEAAEEPDRQYPTPEQEFPFE